MRLNNTKFNYKWVILTTCFFMVFICLGFCSSTKGMYLDAITAALNIPRSLFSINDSCRYIASAIINLFFGSLIYRFGIRKMTAFGFISLIGSSLIYAFAQSIYVFYIGGILLGVGLAFTTSTMASCVIRRWFKDNIGKYTGIVFAANGVGGAVAAQVVSPLINEEGNPFGYRNSYLVVAGLLLVFGIIVVCLLKEWPKEEDTKIASQVKVAKKRHGSTWVGIDYSIAKKRPYFYMTAAGVLLTGFLLQGISGVYAAHLKGVGLDPSYVATVVSVHSLALTVFKIAVGALYDHSGLRAVLGICQGASVIIYVILAATTDSLTGKILAMAFGILYSLALPLETIVIPLIVNEIFGNASYDKILGILISMNHIGYALGAPIVNLSYDILGSYKPILIIFSGIMLLILIGFQFVLNTAQKEKKAVLATREPHA